MAKMKDSNGFAMTPRAYRILWDAHSLAGVVFGLLLFVIFYCGTFSVFRAEIMMWADPALDRPAGSSSGADDVISPILRKHPPKPGADIMVVYPFSGRPFYWLRYEQTSGQQMDTWVGAGSGELVPPRGRSRLSETIYKLHYFEQLGLPGRIASGIVAVFMGFALLTGLLIYLKKLPSRIHTFRPESSLKTAMADAHAALGVLGLPFTLMYAVTGAFFSLLIILLGPTIALVFDGDQEALDTILTGAQIPQVEQSDAPADMLTPDQLLAVVRTNWGDFEPVRLDYVGWGRKGARALVEGNVPETLATSGKAVIDAVGGELIDGTPPSQATSLGRTVAVMTNLHFASFGGLLLDLLYFGLGLVASGVILSGNLLWLLARRSKDPRSTPWVHRLLARLTVGVGVGLTAALPIAFIGSRLMPLEMPGRLFWEDAVLFGGWLLLMVLAFFGPSAQWAARLQLGMAGIASLLVVLAGRWVSSMRSTSVSADALIVEIGFLVSGVALLALARALRPQAASKT